jgi:hypothetical protein
LRFAVSKRLKNNLPRQVVFVLGLVATLVLTGCESSSRLAGRMLTAAWQGPEAPPPPKDSRFEYLQVRTRDQVSYWALGYREPARGGPRAWGQTQEAWYSGSGQVLELVDGRIVSTAGLPVDWRATAGDGVPALQAMLTAAPLTYQRVRDVSPGYRYGVRDEIEVRTETLADGTIVVSEHVSATTAARSLPDAKFFFSRDGTGAVRLTHSLQCLDEEWCFHLTPWPPQPKPN